MNSLKSLELIIKTTNLDLDNKLGGYHNEVELIKKDLEALETIKKHIRHFKRPVNSPTEKISFVLFKNISKDYEEFLAWVHSVEKEMGWKL